MSKEIKIRWVCQHFVGQAYWQNTEDYESDECDTEFTTEDLLDNWDEKCCSAICPNCKSELTQKYDEPTRIDEKT